MLGQTVWLKLLEAENGSGPLEGKLTVQKKKKIRVESDKHATSLLHLSAPFFPHTGSNLPKGIPLPCWAARTPGTLGASLGGDSDSHLLQGYTDGHSDVRPPSSVRASEAEEHTLASLWGSEKQAPLPVQALLFSPDFPPLAFRDSQSDHRQMWQRK